MRAYSDKFVANVCQESYYQFFLTFWPLIAAEKLIRNWHIKKLCDELQDIAERVFLDKPKEYDCIINCPPGTSKSSIVSILWQAWIWTRMPSARFISGSYSERLALDHSRKSRDVVISDKYRALFPFIKLREDQNTKGYFTNSAGGMRFATGVGGSVTGMHAHFITIDDPLDPIGALSDPVINEANIWITETLSDRKVDKQLTPTVLIMQRLHQDDPSGNWLDRGGRIKHICLPAEDSWEVKPEEWRSFYVNGLLDAQRPGMNKASLEEAAKRGEAYYAGQYGQSPIPRGGALFKVDRIQISAVPPDKWKRGPVRFWDKAATQGGRGSFTSGTKMAIDFDDKLWILDVVRFRLDSGAREKMILEIAEKDGRNVRIGIEQEPGSGGKESAERAARNYTLAGFRATIDPVRGSKEARASSSKTTGTGDIPARADSFSVHVNTGNLILLKGAWNRDFIEEMRFFPVSKYNDQVDSSSGAFAMLVRPKLMIGALR